MVSGSRTLAASAADIPPHRRGRAAAAIGKALEERAGNGEEAAIIVIVFIECFCRQWQRGGNTNLQVRI